MWSEGFKRARAVATGPLKACSLRTYTMSLSSYSTDQSNSQVQLIFQGVENEETLPLDGKNGITFQRDIHESIIKWETLL